MHAYFSILLCGLVDFVWQQGLCIFRASAPAGAFFNAQNAISVVVTQTLAKEKGR